MPKIDFQSGEVSTNISSIIVRPPGRKLSNWLLEYANYTASNEAPESFHLWIGLGTIAGAVRRRVQMSTAFFDVHSNMYLILVAPPGTARKTTALKIGQNLLKEVPGIHFTTKASSPAALIKQFATLPEKEHQSLTAYAYELGTFFSTSPAEMVDLVTDLYDCNPDWDKQTISRDLEKIPRPWLNLMAATTPQWLGDYLSPTAVEGGFARRSIFIYEDTRKLSNPFPQVTPEIIRLKRLLINDLTHISTLNGEFTFSPEAADLYTKWYMDMSRFPSMPDQRVTGYYENKHILLLKVAMLISLSERDELILQPQDLQTGLNLLESTEPGMKRSFSSVGKNVFATDMERVLAQIKSRGKTGMRYGEIVSANYHSMNKRELDEQLSQLQSMGVIEMNTSNVFFAKGMA